MSLDSKEYRLGWNEHSNNFTASFKDLLEQKELVDVTLVADGHSFLAHRLVLSALSPYFRHIFTQVPANQQAFVFMKDISHQTMEGLLAFIYTGEVIVHQESLAEFLKIAKSLNIKGLIDPICSASFTQDEPIESLWPESKYNNQKLQYQSTQTSQRKRSNQQSVNQMILDSTAESSQTSPDHQFNPNYSVDAAANDFSLGSFDYEKNASPNISDDYYERIGAKYSMKGKSTDANDREYFVDKKVVKIKPSIAKRSRKIDLNEFNIAADIQTDRSGHERLFYDGYTYRRHEKGIFMQRWTCLKKSMHRCRASVSTTDIDGVQMMKLLNIDHCHGP